MWFFLKYVGKTKSPRPTKMGRRPKSPRYHPNWSKWPSRASFRELTGGSTSLSVLPPAPKCFSYGLDCRTFTLHDSLKGKCSTILSSSQPWFISALSQYEMNFDWKQLQNTAFSLGYRPWMVCALAPPCLFLPFVCQMRYRISFLNFSIACCSVATGCVIALIFYTCSISLFFLCVNRIF